MHLNLHMHHLKYYDVENNDMFSRTCFEWPPKLSIKIDAKRKLSVLLKESLMTLLTMKCLTMLSLVKNDYE